MAAVSSIPAVARFDISSAPTIDCSLEPDARQKNRYYIVQHTTPTNDLYQHQTGSGLAHTSRLSAKDTLVTLPPANNASATAQYLAGTLAPAKEAPTAVLPRPLVAHGGDKMIQSAPPSRVSNIDGGVHAVDGALSLTIRPAGWTHRILGGSVRRLGAGTGGCVDLHRSKIVNKVFAVKSFAARDTPSQGARIAGVLSRGILEELGIAMNVHHRNIVRTFEVIVETDHKCYVVMEPCSVDLFTLLQKHTIAKGTCVPDDVLSCYFVQLVRGVRYLHSIGVAHRDLKLDNACVTEQGVVKIVDFGCATLFRRRVQVPAARSASHPSPTLTSLGNKPVLAGSQISPAARTQSHSRHRGAARSRAAPYSIPRQQAANPPLQSPAGAQNSMDADTSRQYVEMLSMGMCGSDPYMAPELFTVDHYAAAKVDIWALGIIYFAMRHMQFPWAVAHSSRDPHYMAFVQTPGAFFDAWFSTSSSNRWSIQSSFLTTAKKPSENSTAASLAAKDIMRRIFDQNPATRADIYDIARDPWFQSLRCCVGEERKSDDAGACGEHHVHWTPSTEEP